MYCKIEFIDGSEISAINQDIISIKDMLNMILNRPDIIDIRNFYIEDLCFWVNVRVFSGYDILNNENVSSAVTAKIVTELDKQSLHILNKELSKTYLMYLYDEIFEKSVFIDLN